MPKITTGLKLRPIAAAAAMALGSSAPIPASGYPLADEFQINTTTDNHQQL